MSKNSELIVGPVDTATEGKSLFSVAKTQQYYLANILETVKWFTFLLLEIQVIVIRN